MNAEVLPYHWDNREKLFNDYQYLKDIYENTLKALQKQLNEIHQVDHSLRYWRILVGPWLGWFIQMVFDRWSMLNCAFKNYEISGCRVLSKNESTFIPNNMNGFSSLLVDDNWNEVIYSQLLQEHLQNNVLIELVKQTHDQPKETFQAKGLLRSGLSQSKRYVVSICNKYKRWFHNSDKYFFINTYLPPAIEDELLLLLGQKPQSWKVPSIADVEANMQMRDWLIGEYDSFDKFSNVVSRMISQHIPTAYLEGYNSLVDCIENVAWPANPKCIFTSNALHSYDVFKAWAAQQIENGASFVIGQHGGHYGIGLWLWIEEHEIAISDRYLSWGWNEPDQPKVHPVGQIKQRVSLGVNHAAQSGLLLVTTAMPRYSYHMYSSFVSSQWLDYLEDQFIFTENLSPIIQNTLTVRLYAQDYRWDQEKRWGDRFPNVALDSGKKNIDELIARSRVFVSTYNAATYLESFTMNIPTVIFWNPKHWELRDTAVSYFEDLKRVGIFHDTPEAAACHVKDVWDDINSWWDDRLVRKALRRFKERYCNQQTDLLTSVEAELREEVINHSHTNNL